MTTLLGGWGVPGVGSALETTEQEILWGGQANNIALWRSAIIEGATRDAGASPTTILRPGLLLGKLDADNKLTDYDPDAVDGSEKAYAILGNELRAQDFNATDADRVFRVLVAGPVKASRIQGLDDQARKQLGSRFIFDDDLIGGHNFLGAPWVNEEVTATATLTAADNGKRLVINGAAAVVITMPALATNPGFKVEMLVVADEDFTVTSAELDNIVVGNDLSADSVAWTTTGEQIGVRVQMEAIFIGTTPKWLLTYWEPVLGTEIGTITFAIAT
jgi:hypothetical protein